MSRWFRMYNEALDDPKVQSLGGNDFKGWVNVLLLACRHDGVLPAMDDVAFALRLNITAARKLIKTLTNSGLIDPTGTDDSVGIPHGWHNRQYKSDVSTDRVKRFRNGKRNVSSAVTGTSPDTETESETDLVPSQEVSSLGGRGTREGSPFRVLGGGK